MRRLHSKAGNPFAPRSPPLKTPVQVVIAERRSSTRVPPSIPAELARTTIELRGAAGVEWLERLPALVAACGERWSLEVGPPFPQLSFNYAAPARRIDGTAAVLKLSYPDDPGFHMEAEALRLFAGRGAALLLELDKGRGAMLLERLEPGVPLTTVGDDEEATSIAAGVMRRLWRPVPRDHQFPTVSEWARGFDRLRRSFGGGTGPMPVTLVEEAEGLFADLLASEEEPVLLHGDLHHHNVLAARREPWLAIDPKASGEASTRPRCCTTPWRRWGSPGPARSWNGA